MRKRAEDLDATRERIVEATAALHVEHGVLATTYLQIADRAGVGAATVYRHFPTLGSLVEACGAHLYQVMRPPVPEDAAAVFAGLESRPQRLDRLVAELDAFYERGSDQLGVAARDRDRVPELDIGLQHVEAGVAALVTEAFPDAPPAAIPLATALADISVWRALKKADPPPAERRRVWAGLMNCAIGLAVSGADRSDGSTGG